MGLLGVSRGDSVIWWLLVVLLIVDQWVMVLLMMDRWVVIGNFGWIVGGFVLDGWLSFYAGFVWGLG